MDEPRLLRHWVNLDTASLTVINVSTQDAGTYTCSAYNGLGAAADASAYLNVTCKQALFSTHAADATKTADATAEIARMEAVVTFSTLRTLRALRRWKSRLSH